MKYHFSKLQDYLIEHFKSTRFIIVLHAIYLSFLGAIIKAIFESFPYAVFVGILNGAVAAAYAIKTFEPGAKERRKNHVRKD